MTTVASPEEVCNLALDRIGYPESIGDLYEGTRAASVALRLYSQVRDDTMRQLNPSFSRRSVGLTLLKTAPPGGYGVGGWTPAYPPPPWRYEYAYPGDCLVVRTLRAAPMVSPSFLPSYALFALANDSAPPGGGAAQRVILTDLVNAIAVYTAQVVDVTTWEPVFVEAMVAALGRRMGQALGASPDAVKAEASEEVGTARSASMDAG